MRLDSQSKSTPYESASHRSSPKGGATVSVRISNKPAILKELGMTGAIDSLRQFLQARWNADAGLLNLENMAGDSVFKSSNFLAPGQKGAPRNTAPAMWKLASEICPGVRALPWPKVASNNGLYTLTDLAPAALIRFLPKIRNLSLQNNSFTQFADLNPLSTVVGTIAGSKPGLSELRELILLENPVRDREVKRNAGDYTAEIRRRFPSLQMLDQVAIDQAVPVPVVTAHSSIVNIAGLAKRRSDDQRSAPSDAKRKPAKRSKVSLPLTLKPAFSDTEASSTAMSTFLAKQIAKQKQLTWASYLGSSYEQSNNTSSNQENYKRREETLHTGPDAIVAVLLKLPATSHPLSDASKFVVDTWQQPGPSETLAQVLTVVVHGEFAEQPSMGLRSFDRTFVLAPAGPGTSAATLGWPCVIVSDSLMVRNWVNPAAFTPDAPNATASAPSLAPSTVPIASSDPVLNPEQQALMNQLHEQTRLNAQFCYQCLSETGWVLQNALQAFEAAKASIPPEAFA
ncbi:nuclear mRNA export, poly(A)+RNA binding protein [Cystobasidiomycetes sp. EMM_F5]